MGIRETLNKNPAITTGATVGILILAIAAIVWQITSSSGSSSPPTKAFYTTDDGQTYFVDSLTKNAPFQKDGKTVYRCYVFTCDGGKTKTVAYLERFTPEAKKQLDEAAAKGQRVDLAVAMAISSTGTEIKGPKSGDKGWTKAGDRNPTIMAATAPKCAGGSIENLEPVQP